MLMALIDVADDEREKMSATKLLTVPCFFFLVVLFMPCVAVVCYAISPLICFSVVGSLKASEAAMRFP